MVHGHITRRVLIDDSADPDYGAHLEHTYGSRWELVHHTDRRGFAGAVQSAWDHIADGPETHVFHLEDDFTFNRHVDLDVMARILDRHPHLVQLALRRQPVNDLERSAGGIVEMWPDQYFEVAENGQHHWLEHRLFFTTNPSLYPRSLTSAPGWPQVDRSERAFTDRLLANTGLRFGFWGKRSDRPWVHHIGDHRVGVGY
jgi:hypothetical protein